MAVALVEYADTAINSGVNDLASDRDDCDAQMEDGSQIEPDKGYRQSGGLAVQACGTWAY